MPVRVKAFESANGVRIAEFLCHAGKGIHLILPLTLTAKQDLWRETKACMVGGVHARARSSKVNSHSSLFGLCAHQNLLPGYSNGHGCPCRL